MTSRDIILGNLDFSGPERIGMDFSDGRMNDFCDATISLAPKRTWIAGNQEFTEDVWGNVWYRIVGMSKGGEIHTPAIQDWAMLDSYNLPSLDDPNLYTTVAKTFREAGDKFRMSMLPGFPFAISRYLRRMEIYLQDVLLERENVDRLHGKVAALLERMIDRYADAGADGIFTCEDWGTQERLLVSPALWRDIYKPLFRRLCARVHSRGMRMFLHSCGCVWDIVDDLADAGVDVLQFDQPTLHGTERLAARLQERKVCLFSPVDIQKVLPTGDKARIEAEARDMIRLFGGKKGGLIAKNYGDLPGIGVKPEWDGWAYETFVKHGRL